MAITGVPVSAGASVGETNSGVVNIASIASLDRNSVPIRPPIGMNLEHSRNDVGHAPNIFSRLRVCCLLLMAFTVLQSPLI